MKNLARILGIAALAAAMAFVALSCKEDPPSAPPPKAIFNLSADYGLYPGYPITATVIDLEIEDITLPFPKTMPSHALGTATDTNVVIFWVKADAAIYTKWLQLQDPEDATMDEKGYEAYLATLTDALFTAQVENDASGNTSTQGRLFKPDAIGNYNAGIVDFQEFKKWKAYLADSSAEAVSFPQPLFAPKEAKVVAKPQTQAFQAMEPFLGKWTMSPNYVWTAVGATGEKGKSREIVKIGPGTFRVFLNEPWGNKGNQGVQFEIASWDSLGADALTTESTLLKGKKIFNPDTGAEENLTKNFKSGFKLTLGEELLNQGYTTYKNFYVFKDYSDLEPLFLVRTNEGGATLVRSYLNQTPPDHADIMKEDWSVTGDSNYN